MRSPLVALLLFSACSCTFFSTVMAPFKYLKQTYWDTPVESKPNDSFHESLITQTKVLKRDGLYLTYNIIHYNYLLNLQRACLLHLQMNICQTFVDNAKQVLDALVKSDQAKKMEPLSIQDFHDLLFKKTGNEDVDRSLEFLSEYLFNGNESFDLKGLLDSYERNLQRLSTYFKVGLEKASIKVRESSRKEEFLDYE